MPEPTDGSKKKLPKPPGKEMSMDVRLLLAFVLMGAVLMVTQYLYKPEQKAVKPVEPAKTSEAQKPTPPKPEDTKPAAAKPDKAKPDKAKPEKPVEQVAAQKAETFAIDSPLYRVEFTNQGAVVKGWTLKKFLDNNGKPLQLVNQAAKDKVWYPFTLEFKDSNIASVNLALFVAKPTADGNGIDYQYSDGKIDVKKSFRFTPGSYMVQVRTEATLNGTAIPHVIQWRGGFGDAFVHNAWSTQHTVYFDASNNKLHVNDAKAAKDGPVTALGGYEFAGIEDTFFAAVFLPRQPGAPVEIRTLSDTVPVANGVQQQEAHVGAAVGGAGVNEYSLFVGPKDIDLLKTVDPKLAQIVNWGWFGIIAKPIFMVLNWTNDQYVHNYGWSIVLVTIMINILLLPLKYSSLKSAKKMQALQPRIQAINEKYKGIGLKDPKKQQQNEEMMALYKEAGVNPLGGCLPLVIQLPFLYAFYTVLTVSIEMRGARWLWVNDLSQPEQWAIHLLPILLIVTQFLLQKMTPAAPGQDPTQAKMMMFMPLLFGFMFYSMSSGLVLYWLTTNVVGILQQWVINRMTPAPAVAPPAPTNKRTRR